ncbi:hypothetical protein NQ314_017134 [Rhamnusium bicolor]|uniref:Peroxidase n=1 Tax=Rhamnusium bicolor TaxID=1586634 RepID=A0AAV8WUE9_9CUCU|nr:hypothetical protein NQ314_017134 [Rhamnusium bicolor]
MGLKITEKDLNSSVTFANSVINNMKRLETSLGWSDISVKHGTPSHGMYISFAPEREAIKRGRDALVALKASVQLMNTFCNQLSCERLEWRCSPDDYLSSYRSINGICNHITSGTIGESFTAYTRLLYPVYLDNIHEIRRAVNKRPLPSARLVSMSLVNHTENLHDRLTLAVMLWGQFLEHDLSRPATSVMERLHTEHSIDCCRPEGKNLSPRYIHPFCSPVSVPADDKYYAEEGVDCMSYVRSIPAIRSDCSFGPSDQVNQATHYLDGSQMYGSTIRKSNMLRSYVNGKLDVSSLNGKYYLPTTHIPEEHCQVDSPESPCFKSGDSRVNFQPQLTVMHTIWYREHNRIAEQLAALNTQWEDEILFQEARRIVIAEMQHITYNEWISKVLAHKYVTKIERFGNYDADEDPSVSNSFATAAMRALKSLYDGNINHFGFDVLSMDIQRGRDHGLPSYVEYRSLCGFPKAQEFGELSDVMSEEHISALSKVYSSPKDVDLIIGGLMENPEEGSLLGPTFSCIIADQFMRTKKGDRYFYTNENQPRPFAMSQLSEIKKVTLARIFCDNADNITMMQPNVFEKN